MELNLARVQEAHKTLAGLLGDELSQIVDAVLSGDERYAVELPHSLDVDLTIEDISSKVALTSNVYGSIARLASVARAEYKLVKGQYDRKYKSNRVGKNDAERERNAMLACEEEHLALSTLDAIIELAEGLESRARVASESSRKILGALQTMYSAHLGERRGQVRERDYSSY